MLDLEMKRAISHPVPDLDSYKKTDGGRSAHAPVVANRFRARGKAACRVDRTNPTQSGSSGMEIPLARIASCAKAAGQPYTRAI